jgi:hypothetical protein
MNESIDSILLTTLQNAISQDVAFVKQAESNLQLFQKEKGFFSKILTFYQNQQLDSAVRYIALITFKNGIDRYWRKTQTK